MPTRRKRLLRVRPLLLGGVLLLSIGVFSGTVSASPLPTIVGTTMPPQEMIAEYMGRLFEILHVTVFYVGLTSLMIGVVLGFLGQQRGERSMTGYSIGVGGAMLLLLYYGYDILFGLLRWTFKVGTW